MSSPRVTRKQLAAVFGEHKTLKAVEDLFTQTADMLPVEALFTPTLYGTGVAGAPVYATQAGRYIKLGSHLFGSISIAITARGGLTGGVCIGGLPYTIADSAAAEPALSIAYVANLNLAANDPLFGKGLQNTTTAALYRQAIVGAPAALQETEITDTFSIQASFHYEVKD